MLNAPREVYPKTTLYHEQLLWHAQDQKNFLKALRHLPSTLTIITEQKFQ
jgi:hypothetical protein